jgi:hypothetical protein
MKTGWLTTGHPARGCIRTQLWAIRFEEQEPSDLSIKHKKQAHLSLPRITEQKECAPTCTRGGLSPIAPTSHGGGALLRLWLGCLASAEKRWRHWDEAAKGEAGVRCNTQSTFETSRCNTCIIRLKTDETHETCIWNTHLKIIVKHTEHPDKTLATYVWNIYNIQNNTLATYVWKNRTLGAKA